MPSKAHDLFLLMLTLSGIREEERIVPLFCDAMPAIWPSLAFAGADASTPPEQCVVLSRVRGEPLLLCIRGDLDSLPAEDRALIHNAVQLLGIVVDRAR